MLNAYKFSGNEVYFGAFATGLIVTLAFTPVMRLFAVSMGILDLPDSDVKTHKATVPYLGGVAVFAGFAFSLLLSRLLTDFPSGTLHSLRGILSGSTLVFFLGLADDVRPRGLNFKTKFVFQFFTAWLLLLFDVRLHFIKPVWFANLLTVLWVVGVTNAFNLVDIMDGLSSGIAFVASFAFLVISLPNEAIYVNIAAAALGGACMGFFPYNISGRYKIFMGDAGSLFIGFVLAALSLGTSYSKVNEMAVLSPILILGLPLYDTILVTALRLSRGRSPFLGSKDHFALRLEALGFSRKEILVIVLLATLILSLCAYLATRLNLWGAAVMFGVVVLLVAVFSWRISRVKVS